MNMKLNSGVVIDDLKDAYDNLRVYSGVRISHQYRREGISVYIGDRMVDGSDRDFDWGYSGHLCRALSDFILREHLETEVPEELTEMFLREIISQFYEGKLCDNMEFFSWVITSADIETWLDDVRDRNIHSEPDYHPKLSVDRDYPQQGLLS